VNTPLRLEALQKRNIGEIEGFLEEVRVMTVQEAIRVLQEAILRLREIAEDEVDEDIAYRARKALEALRMFIEEVLRWTR